MGIEVSIIIPSFNKYPQNLLTLQSLQSQDFDHEAMEVILVDDGSTDNTNEIPNEFTAKFQFKYIRLEENMGRSKTRNIGIREAEGELLIFLDAEMVVNPDFTQRHYMYHKMHEKAVLTGGLGFYNLYSFVYPDFDKYTINKIAKLVRNDRVLKRRFRSFTRTKQPTQLIYPEDIASGRYKKLSYFSQIPLDKRTIELFGEDLSEFQTPWMAFLTGNVSVKKDDLEKVGYFEESFEGWGFEDWELGYRLYKSGVTFAYKQEAASFHQEHLTNGKSKSTEAYRNFHLFQQKHMTMDVLVVVFILTGKYNRIGCHEILKQYRKLETDYPDRFEAFKASFPLLLQNVSQALAEGKPIDKIQVYSDDQRMEKLICDRECIQSLGGFQSLTEAFDYLIDS
ncbi:glycosyltransferase family 2 protein [Pseudalkalibacillus sp. SCS-8]|uniref:glycosyltransferase family 2 protein n=1 Tax=Pseudalkalibacillus nanhaiensis TaxID=3115291 RepID=UPI0032DA24A2